MNNEEIINLFTMCMSAYCDGEECKKYCPYYGKARCADYLSIDVINLVTEQEAEIKRLKKLIRKVKRKMK